MTEIPKHGMKGICQVCAGVYAAEQHTPQIAALSDTAIVVMLEAVRAAFKASRPPA